MIYIFYTYSNRRKKAGIFSYNISHLFILWNKIKSLISGIYKEELLYSNRANTDFKFGEAKISKY